MNDLEQDVLQQLLDSVKKTSDKDEIVEASKSTWHAR